MRILHLSNLEIVANDSSREDVLSDLAHRIVADGKRNQIDSIVISGGVTADGLRSSYGAAERVLAAFCDMLLVLDAGTVRRNRMVIVPGKTDLPLQSSGNWERCREFREFHRRFYATEIANGRMAEFPPNGVFCRQMKNLAVLGVSCWRATESELRGQLLFDIRKGLESVKYPAERYASGILAILVSAESFLLSCEQSERGAARMIYEICRRRLGVDLHLFGSGDVAGHIPEPSSLNPLALGTGYRRQGEFWPFRANLLEIASPYYAVFGIDYSKRMMDGSRSETGRTHGGPSDLGRVPYARGQTRRRGWREAFRGDVVFGSLPNVNLSMVASV